MTPVPEPSETRDLGGVGVRRPVHIGRPSPCWDGQNKNPKWGCILYGERVS